MVAKEIEAKYTLFNSLEEMIMPETLSDLLSQPVTRIERQPMNEHSGLAGGRLNYVETNIGRVVLKRMSIDSDWIMYATDDQKCRSVRLWQYGLLDQLRPHLEHKIIGCAKDGDGWAILMVDLTGHVFAWNKPIPPKLVSVFLDRLAMLHATFWNDPHLHDPRLGLCDSDNRLDFSALTLAQNHKDDHRGPVPGWIRAGWKIMESSLEKDVFLHLSRLLENPQPLIGALDHYPFTLLHGDYREPNLAYFKPDHLVAFDWQMASRTLMTVDLVWFTGRRTVRDAMDKDQAHSYYRGCLETYLGTRFDDTKWQAMLDLGNLYNDLFVTCLNAYFSKNADRPDQRAYSEMTLQERNQQVRDGMRWL